MSHGAVACHARTPERQGSRFLLRSLEIVSRGSHRTGVLHRCMRRPKPGMHACPLIAVRDDWVLQHGLASGAETLAVGTRAHTTASMPRPSLTEAGAVGGSGAPVGHLAVRADWAGRARGALAAVRIGRDGARCAGGPAGAGRAGGSGDAGRAAVRAGLRGGRARGAALAGGGGCGRASAGRPRAYVALDTAGPAEPRAADCVRVGRRRR